MTFNAPKRKMMELLVLPVFCGILYFMTGDIDAIILLTFGFIWNWSASNDLDEIFTNKRYRMSMLRFVVSFQRTILKPFSSMPTIVKKLIAILPAGTFWTLVIILNESVMPWWATFLGSASYELLQLELNFIRNQKGQMP